MCSSKRGVSSDGAGRGLGRSVGGQRGPVEGAEGRGVEFQSVRFASERSCWGDPCAGAIGTVRGLGMVVGAWAGRGAGGAGAVRGAGCGRGESGKGSAEAVCGARFSRGVRSSNKTLVQQVEVTPGLSYTTKSGSRGPACET